MAKKKGKKVKNAVEPTESEAQEEVLVTTTELEPQEEVQYTDTSYTSASFESLPPVIVEEIKPKKKKGKRKSPTAESSIAVVKKSDIFQWSEESFVGIEEELPVVEEEPPAPKKRKGRKGKKEREEEKIPDFPKPKNWKKLNKKEREAWLVQQMEDWRAEKEAEKQAKLAGAKEKRAAEAKSRNEELVLEAANQEVRRDILQKTVKYFHEFERQKAEYDNKKFRKAEWQQYLRCDGLPDPRVVTQMNTYLHVWRETQHCDDEELDKKCGEVLPMVEMLEEFCSNPRLYTPEQMKSYNAVRVDLRNQLSDAIQLASYTLLRDLEKNLKFESTRLAIYEKEFKGLRLNLWVAIKWPTRKIKPVEPDPEPVDLQFPSMQLAVKLPKIIDCSCVCVRAARSMIDLLSESSRSFALAADLPNRYEDLFEFNEKEYVDAVQLKKDQDEIRNKFYKEIKDKTKELETYLKANVYAKVDKEKEELDNLYMAEPPPLPAPREHLASVKEQEFSQYLKLCKLKTRTGEVNLRKYRICGGVLHLDLITTPPQPKRMRNSITLTTLQLPKTLQPVKYQVQYRAPGPPPPGVTRTPEEIEQEIKKVEAQYEKLALVIIDLPQNVLWHEPPVVCQWQAPRQLWTSNYVNDFKFNEDKLTLQFRSGVLWPIGIATLRYSNLPYQGWDLKPDPNSKGVLLSVTGVSVTVTFHCVSNTVRLKNIVNANTPALKEHFNKPFKVKTLMQLMREAACDFFPEFDAHNYVEGSRHKEWVMERHTYHAMAFLSRAYNFQWSRWNSGQGSRVMVMQFREALDTKREGKLQLLYVTPQKATVLKCNEMTQEFSHEPLLGLPFFPDLFALNLQYGSVDARRAGFDVKYKLVETVFELLQEIKVLSF